MIHVAHVSIPKAGERANGDRPVFHRDGSGMELCAVIDALGHGPEAALVATTAADFLQHAPLGIGLAALMRELHAKLAGSRGAAGTVCLFGNKTVEACAVGNVELRTDMKLPLVISAGVLGMRVAKFHVCSAALPTRARFTLFSDGVSTTTTIDSVRSLAPQAACEAIMKASRRSEDDATILVADVE